MKAKQITLFGEETNISLPTTRYQGSKAKLTEWIWSKIKEMTFDSFLDAFGGTGVVGYYMKRRNKEIIYNDNLKFNSIIGKAIIENNKTKLSLEKFVELWKKKPDFDYKYIISNNFKDIYYSNDENIWLDIIIQNIQNLQDEYEKAIAYYVLFQACIIKRPFNLFHRKNLYVREANVERTFGNKITWDKPFEEHTIKFLDEVNNLIYNNHKNNKSLNLDVFDLPKNVDLVYLDPPYTSNKGESVDYRNFYHFLEGITIYNDWENNIDLSVKNKRLKLKNNEWNDKNQISNVFKRVIEYFKDSKIVISYRSDGIPSINLIEEWVRSIKRNVEVYYFDNYKYALSNGRTSEVLIIAY